MVREVLWLTVAAARAVAAQQPPPPDTTRRPQALPAVQTVAPREEREAFITKPNVGFITITGKELAAAPRFFGESDILRAVRLLPGVNARNDFSVGMNVRGGESDQNLVLLDGFPIYNPFHMGGLFGAFVEPMVDRVDFLTGGFPASYGGRLSSVLNVHSAAEPRRGIHGQVDMSFIATTLSLGGGLQGGRSTWGIATRRTYADKFIDIFQPGALPYHFRDVQARVTRVLPGDVRLGVTAYSNVDDMLGTTEDQGEAFTLNWGNQLLGVSAAKSWTESPRLFSRTLGDSAVFTQRLSTSRFNMNMDLFESVLTLKNPVRDVRLAGTLATYTAKHDRTYGYEIGEQRYSYEANYPAILYPAERLANVNRSAGVFFDDLWRPNHRWILQLGVRADGASGLGVAVQPRLSVKYFVSNDLALTAAYGEYAQWAHSLAREDVPIRALDFWIGSDDRAPVSRARHFIGGVEKWLSPARALRVEAYLKHYPSLIEQNPWSDPETSGDEFSRLHGYSYGADLMLRQLQSGRFTGWLAYGFAFSSRVNEQGMRFFPGHDRRHELNAVGNWTRGRWVTAARFNLATGTPYTVNMGEFRRRTYDPRRGTYDGGADIPQLIAGSRNALRVPFAQRLDVSFTRQGDGKGASWSPFLSVLNVYNAENYFAYFFNYESRPPERLRLQQLPVFPTLGVSVAW